MELAGSMSERDLLNAVLSTAQVRVGVLDRDLRFVRAPSLQLANLGAQLIDSGATFAEQFGDLAGAIDGVQNALAGREAHIQFERDGGTHQLTLYPHRSPEGTVDSILVVSAASSHPGTLQRALAEAQARERRIFQSSMVGLLYWREEDGAITDANDTLLTLLGYTREDLMQNRVNWIALTPPEFHHLDQTALEEMRVHGACQPFEKEYVHKNGGRIPVLIGASSWTRGRLAGVAFVVDLSEHRRRQRAFHVSESRLRRVVDLAPIVLWAVDAAGIFTLSTGRGLQALGLVPNQVLGMSVFEVYNDVPHMLGALRRGLAGEELHETLEVRDHFFDSRITPIYGESGKVEGVLGISFDVTERRQAEQQQAALEAQLLEVQKLESLGLLAGGIAHDFNNILTVILGGASSVLMNLPPSHHARAELESIVTAAERAAGLTHQMLAYAGKARVEVRRIDLSAHVGEIAALLETTMSKKVELRLELASNLPAIEADVAQVQQVVMNLVINAADAIGDRAGNVLVKTGVSHLTPAHGIPLFGGPSIASGAYVCLEVSDSGHGMDEATKAKIFDPFFTTKFTGRGLGLAAVRGIVKAHRAVIQVESSVGNGTTFRVLFPSTEGVVASPIPASPLAFRGQGTALVIDDDDSVRKITTRMLEFLGFCVIEAPNGRAGAELFAQRAQEIAIAVVDMTMPEMNGEETFLALRRVRNDIPILLVSGYDELEVTRSLANQSPVAFLRKPFSSADLAGKLVETLARTDPAQLG